MAWILSQTCCPFLWPNTAWSTLSTFFLSALLTASFFMSAARVVGVLSEEVLVLFSPTLSCHASTSPPLISRCLSPSTRAGGLPRSGSTSSWSGFILCAAPPILLAPLCPTEVISGSAQPPLILYHILWRGNVLGVG